ncbi:Protein kinase [Elasticomyces elasticus]|nr:Protein kinase [Elasticomyces elasticus]
MSPMIPIQRQRTSRTVSETPSMPPEPEKLRVSTVKVLNTSLPDVHMDLLKARASARSQGRDPDSVFSLPQAKDHTASPTTPIPEEVRDDVGNPVVLPAEERESIARGLKPHSRSSANLATLALERQAKKSNPKEKPKVRKWQFGIRSRNQPYEAMKCLYTALANVGADWEIGPATKHKPEDEEQQHDDQDGDEPESPAHQLAPGEKHTVMQSKYDWLSSEYYVPRDPWHIRARILKTGMMMPSEIPVSSHSSAVSLPREAQAQLRRHVEEFGVHVNDEFMQEVSAPGPSTNVAQKLRTTASAHSSRPSSGMGEHGPHHGLRTHPAIALSGHHESPNSSNPQSRPESSAGLINHKISKMTGSNIGVWIFVDIQLYTLDSSTYSVDFKCDGYQNVIWYEPGRHMHKTPISSPSPSRPQSAYINGHPSHGTITRNASYESTSDAHGAKIKKEKSSDSASGKGERSDGYWKPISKRFKNVEKEVSSPYPYIDVASDLIAQLVPVQPT